MKAIMLVGGEGTRLRPLTYSTVKAMVPVLNIPFIHHMIRHFASHNINEIILAMGYKPDTIQSYFNRFDKLDFRLVYSIEDIPLGTAGAVKNAEQYINEGDSFFVFNGDIFTDLDLTDMLNFHRDHEAMATIALTQVDDPTQFGVVETDDQQKVTCFTEKPKRHEVTSNLINAGTYILDSKIMKYIVPGRRSMFEHDVFPRLLTDGEPVYGYPSGAYWIDMGTPEKYRQLNYDLLLGKCSLIDSQISDIKIDSQSSVHPDAMLTGPIIIGSGSTVGKNVQIKGPTAIGAECGIGDNTVIDGSIIWENVHIGEGAIIKNCIIANNSQIEDNTNLENNVIVEDPAGNSQTADKLKVYLGG